MLIEVDGLTGKRTYSSSGCPMCLAVGSENEGQCQKPRDLVPVGHDLEGDHRKQWAQIYLGSSLVGGSLKTGTCFTCIWGFFRLTG